VTVHKSMRGTGIPAGLEASPRAVNNYLPDRDTHSPVTSIDPTRYKSGWCA
jgi:hypothetical protein